MSIAADISALASSTTIANIAKALQYGSQINFASAVQAFETANLAGEIQTADDVLKIIGVFLPPVAIAANDLGMAVSGYEILLNLANALHMNAGTLANNAGEQQEQDVQSSIGAGMR